MAAGGVDGKSLGDLDRGLAKKLEFRCKGGHFNVYQFKNEMKFLNGS